MIILSIPAKRADNVELSINENICEVTEYIMISIMTSDIA